MRFIDLFCGIGGFRLGLERANQIYKKRQVSGESNLQSRGNQPNNSNASRGKTYSFHCVWSCDIDKWARQIYKKNFGEEPEGDVRAIRPEDVPQAELYTFGWPCQDNSIAGKRKGQAVDTRSGTLFEAIRIMQAKKPKYFIAENVPGLFSVTEGCDFYETIRMFTDAGYDCQWQVLDTRWFLPQNRKRIFFVGHLRGERRPKVFPIGENGQNDFKGDGKESWGDVGNTLSGRSASGQNARGNYVIGYTRKLDETGRAIRENHLKDDFCQVKQRAGDQDQYILTNSKIRRLTPIECERLQGFPDNWTQGVSDTQRYKLLGNAVTVNVIEFLGKRLAQEVLL